MAAFGAVLALAAYSAHRSLTPHVTRATEAEILAAVPPDLRRPIPVDKAATERFDRLVQILHQQDRELEGIHARMGTKTIAELRSAAYREAVQDEARCYAGLIPQVRALLDGGPIEAPATVTIDPAIQRLTRVVRPQDEVLAAARRGDRRLCVEDALWRLRLWSVREGLGRDVYEGTSAKWGETSGPPIVSGSERVPAGHLLDVATAGGYDQEGLRRILDALPAQLNPFPVWRVRVRRSFVEAMLPQLVAAGAGTDLARLPYFASWGRPNANRVGTLDPVATAKLASEVVRLALRDLERSPDERTIGQLPGFQRSMLEKLPPVRFSGEISDDRLETLLNRLQWQDSLNRGENTLGRRWAVTCAPSVSIDLSNDVLCNLLRAIHQLRSGKTDLPRDPYGKGPLRFDPKRRVVWSIGQNGRDEGGRTLAKNGWPPNFHESDDVAYRY